MMKKIILSLVAVIMLSATSFTSQAQGLLFKGGLNYSNLDFNQSFKDLAQSFDLNVSNYSSFHIGIGYQTESTAGFTLQPELLYSKKGQKFGEQASWNLDYLELPVNVQWGPDLVICRPFVQVSPFVGYSIRSRVSTSNETLDRQINSFFESFTKDANRFEFGLGIGGGIELVRKFQITAQYVWNFGNVANLQDYLDSARNISKDTCGALQISLGLMF